MHTTPVEYSLRKYTKRNINVVAVTHGLTEFCDELKCLFAVNILVLSMTLFGGYSQRSPKPSNDSGKFCHTKHRPV